jgi:hypothetical protein
MGTGTKTLRKHYDKLTDLERLRALIAARVRGDQSEADALYDSAAEATYRMTAWPFRGMYRALVDLTGAVAADLRSAAADMFLGLWLESMHELGDLDADQAEELGADGWPMCSRTTSAGARSILTAWRGLELFCEGVGLDFEQMQAFGPYGGRHELAVFFARLVLEAPNQIGAALVQKHLPGDHEARPAIDADQANRREQEAAELEAAAQEYAADLRKLWDKVTGE